MMVLIVVVSVILAVVPAAMTIVNAFALRTPPNPATVASVAILIPARNEEASIEACLAAAVSSIGVDWEVIVLDDHSSDRTAEIVEGFARRDHRVRLVAAPPLPTGWNGKQHACHVLSGCTERPLLLFIDADVLLAPDGAARLAGAMVADGPALISGVPRQV